MSKGVRLTPSTAVFSKASPCLTSLCSALRTSNSWPDLAKYLNSLSPSEKGLVFEYFVQHYLQLEPTFATVLETVWRLGDIPAHVRSHLNLPATDEGIDLVAKCRNGEYWAIQCKFRGPKSLGISRRELATFTDLAFGVCRNFAQAVVFTTAARFSRKLKLHKERLILCGSERWDALDRNFFLTLCKTLAGTRPRRQRPRRPREHQRRCIQQAYDHFGRNGNTRGKLILPCATGKSLTAYWIACTLSARRILVAVPSLALLRGMIQEWTQEAAATQQRFDWIAVCSDQSVGTIDSSVDLQDLGVRVYSETAEIARWLAYDRKCLRVVFTTYQSGPLVAEASRLAAVSFDLGIFDEAHRTAGQSDRRFSHLLHDRNVTISKRLFMTATERRYHGDGDTVVSMDDTSLYGETVSMLSFKAAQSAKPQIITDYRIVTMAVTRQEIAKLITHNALVRSAHHDSGAIESESLAAAIALRKAMFQYTIRKTVSFHSTVARARSFKEVQDRIDCLFTQGGTLSTFHVAGEMAAGDRCQALREFARSERALVTNARCLSEGVNVPEFDCVLFADPKKSAVDIVQAVGRALRVQREKRLAYVIVPVILDSPRAEDCTSAFSRILAVLKALATHDERIIEYFRLIESGTKRLPRSPISIDLPEGMDVDVESFALAIETYCWPSLARLSWRPFGDARTFVRSLGLRNQGEWRLYIAGKIHTNSPLPLDIPKAPDQVYKNAGWSGFGDWLGTENVASRDRRFRPFLEARLFAQSLGLKTHTEWLAYCRGERPDLPLRPADIPSLPSSTYRNKGWISWGNWLGTEYVANQSRLYLPFAKARAYARSLGFKNEHEWRHNRDKLPVNVPRKPEVVYKNEWRGWGDWLGHRRAANQHRKFLPYTKARGIVHQLGLRSYDEWQLYRTGQLTGKVPRLTSIPSDPYGYYKRKGTWVSWQDWLGT